jgi:hypothetical protein
MRCDPQAAHGPRSHSVAAEGAAHAEHECDKPDDSDADPDHTRGHACPRVQSDNPRFRNRGSGSQWPGDRSQDRSLPRSPAPGTVATGLQHQQMEQGVAVAVLVARCRHCIHAACPACHWLKAVLAYETARKRCFLCPHCQHVWDTTETPHERGARPLNIAGRSAARSTVRAPSLPQRVPERTTPPADREIGVSAGS